MASVGLEGRGVNLGGIQGGDAAEEVRAATARARTVLDVIESSVVKDGVPLAPDVYVSLRRHLGECLALIPPADRVTLQRRMAAAEQQQRRLALMSRRGSDANPLTREVAGRWVQGGGAIGSAGRSRARLAGADGPAESTLLLKSVRRNLEAENVRLERAAQGLEAVSDNMRKSRDIFKSYAVALKNAKKEFKKVLDKAETDGRYLYYSWLFFCGVCCYIILKRLMLLRLLRLCIRLTRYLSALLTRLIAKYVTLLYHKSTHGHHPIDSINPITHVLSEHVLNGDSVTEGLRFGHTAVTNAVKNVTELAATAGDLVAPVVAVATALTAGARDLAVEGPGADELRRLL